VLTLVSGPTSAIEPPPKANENEQIFRPMSFGGLFVRAIGFGNDHVKRDGEGFYYHQSHAAMVMIFEAKGCETWCPKRLKDKDHTYISGSMDERITMSSQCLHEPQQKELDKFGFSEAP
jgi:hypothetical protein